MIAIEFGQRIIETSPLDVNANRTEFLETKLVDFADFATLRAHDAFATPLKGLKRCPI